MKVIHVIKKIEMIDQDVKELKKLEKSVKKNKSFSTPIYMSIEKQINIILGERIKLFELKIENPPQQMLEDIEGKAVDEKPKHAPQTAKKQKIKKSKNIDYDDMDDIPMLTQDQIDARFSSIDAKEEKNETGQKINNDESVKILDIALEKGSLGEKEITKEKDKKVKFFRDNFPVE